VEAAGATPPMPTRPPAICFIDLSGYTALTEELGDQVAAERAGTLGTLLQELAHTRGGRVVKLLGDGAMLQFPDPSTAVRCGLEMVEQVEQAGLPPARVGIASGPVVFRDGDCYGRVREPGRPRHGPRSTPSGPGNARGRDGHAQRARPLPEHRTGQAQGDRRRHRALGRLASGADQDTRSRSCRPPSCPFGRTTSGGPGKARFRPRSVQRLCWSEAPFSALGHCTH
jgi:hypothetical protein